MRIKMAQTKVCLMMASLVASLCMTLCITAQANPHTVGNQKIKADFFRDRLKREKDNPMLRPALIDSLLKYSDSENELQRLVSMKADALLEIGNYNLALPLYEQLCNEGNFRDDMALELHDKLSSCYYYAGLYDMVIENAAKMLEMPKRDSLRYYDIKAYTDMANVYIRFQDMETATHYLDEVYRLLKDIPDIDKKKNNELRIRYWLSSSGVNILKKDYEAAYSDLQNAGSLPGDPQTDLLLNINRAVIYIAMQEYELADECYRRISAFPYNHYNKLLGINNYAVSKLYNGNLDEALAITDRNLRDIREMGFDHLMTQVYLIRSAAFVAKNDYRRAYETLDSAKMVTDSLISFRTMHNIMLSTSRYGRTLDAREVRKHQQWEKAKDVAIVVLLAIALALAVWIWMRQRKVTTLRRDLEKQTRKYMLAEKHGNELDMEGQRVRNELSECILETDRMKEVVRDSILRLSTAGVAEKHLRQLKEILNDDGGDTASRSLEVANHDFIQRLGEAHPDLTRGEIRMAVYISMGKSTREIAEMLNRSVRTVETVKYRLNKKLSDALGERSLPQYLSTFGSSLTDS